MKCVLQTQSTRHLDANTSKEHREEFSRQEECKLASLPSFQDWLKKLHRTCSIRKFSFPRISLFPVNCLTLIRHCQPLEPTLYHNKAFHSGSSDSSSEPGIPNNALVRPLWVHWPLKSLNFKLPLHKAFPACLCFGLLQSVETSYALKPVFFFFSEHRFSNQRRGHQRIKWGAYI